MTEQTGATPEPTTEANNADTNAEANSENAVSGQPQKYESWFENQTPELQGLITEHHDGLHKALKAERGNRRGLEKQLRELSETMEGEHQATLKTMADNLRQEEVKSQFYEDAQRAGVKNLRLAYAVAVQDNLFDRRGLVNFEDMQKVYPELFGVVVSGTRNLAGAGTGSNHVPAKKTMDDLIRGKLGR